MKEEKTKNEYICYAYETTTINHSDTLILFGLGGRHLGRIGNWAYMPSQADQHFRLRRLSYVGAL